ncbi:hypothetical protein HanPI659440_Chr14g0566171 [Helianthus annuus]|nr:hypothetical protein HanPI659440_Chr14g0566171 [Helianthus annuus]
MVCLLQTLKQYKLAELTPIEAVADHPLSRLLRTFLFPFFQVCIRCGYPAVNASYYDLSFHPVSSNKDCKTVIRASKASFLHINILCYMLLLSPKIVLYCIAFRAGVAQYIKTKWRVVAIFNVILLVILSMVYFVGCCARRNAAWMHSKV